MTRPVSAAIVGAGYISEFHANAIGALPGVELKAVCDLNRGRAERFANAHQIGRVYDDLAAMLAGEDLDVAHVLTPPNAHFHPTRQVLEAGVDAFVEKPLCHTSEACAELEKLAKSKGRVLATSHNFFFYDAYERLHADVSSGRLGRVDHVDVVWNKELGQIKGGPYNAWMLTDPKHILFEVAPHCFAHAMHLVDGLDRIHAEPFDAVTLPGGLRFFRKWEILGWKGDVSVRIRLSFIEGYPENYVHVRGSNGSGRADFEQNTYVRNEHSPMMLDVDRYANTTKSAVDTVVQGTGTLMNFVLSKAGMKKIGAPFDLSIAKAVQRFYETRTDGLDDRLSVHVAAGAVSIGERVAESARSVLEQSGAGDETETSDSDAEAVPAKNPTTLVIGGTGFIGKALVRKLVESGQSVRVMSRSARSCPPELRDLGVDVAQGDFTDLDAMRSALEGIVYVYHLGRGYGTTWDEYLKYDVDPTTRLAELCHELGVKRFFYASSIAIYDAGKSGTTINEETMLNERMLAANPYARSKAENEKNLLRLHHEVRFPVVIFRPAIVLGKGGNPYHWGIAAWPYKSVCRLYGDGKNVLPIVLVDDVAEAMTRALNAPGIEGQSYILTSPPSITTLDYLDAFEQRAGIQIRRVPTSGVRAYGEEVAKWVIKSIGRDPNATLPSYADVRGKSFASTLDGSKAERDFDWVATKDRATLIEKGIHEPVDDYFAE